jgi:hypothetical protein
MLNAASQSPRSRSLYAALAEAAEDPVVRRALNRVASARIEYLEVCYRELGLEQPLAKAKAVLAYAAPRAFAVGARGAGRASHRLVPLPDSSTRSAGPGSARETHAWTIKVEGRASYVAADAVSRLEFAL